MQEVLVLNPNAGSIYDIDGDSLYLSLSKNQRFLGGLLHTCSDLGMVEMKIHKVVCER